MILAVFRNMAEYWVNIRDLTASLQDSGVITNVIKEFSEPPPSGEENPLSGVNMKSLVSVSLNYNTATVKFNERESAEALSRKGLDYRGKHYDTDAVQYCPPELKHYFESGGVFSWKTIPGFAAEIASMSENDLKGLIMSIEGCNGVDISEHFIDQETGFLRIKLRAMQPNQVEKILSLKELKIRYRSIIPYQAVNVIG